MTAPCLFCGELQPDHYPPQCPKRPPLPRDPLQPGRPFPAPQVPANPRDVDHGAVILEEVARRWWKDPDMDGRRQPDRMPWDELDEDTRNAVRQSVAGAVVHTLAVASEVLDR